MGKAVAYVRVSTVEQGRSGLGLDAQRAAVRSIAAQRGLTLLAEFTEVESGKRNDRPELNKALHHAKITGSVLVIAKLDRLSRNAAFLLTLRDSGVRFLAADIPDANDLTIGVLAVVAQAEREAISRRTTEALATIKTRIAAEGSYTSAKSGRTIHRLGSPGGAEPLRRAGKGNAAGVAAVKEKALRLALDLKPVMSAVRASGAESLRDIADAFNAMGIATSRGGRWAPSSIANLATRIRLAGAESS
jgi:DNA invertase Pin-like site-specific DNA recombinase